MEQLFYKGCGGAMDGGRRTLVLWCPGWPADETGEADCDARRFEPVVAAVEQSAPGVEVLRPGMVACRMRGPTRYFGSENAAAEHLVDTVEALDVECSLGIAGSLPVAVLAARRGIIVPPRYDESFVARLPIEELVADPAIATSQHRLLIGLLQRLGIVTAGDFAALAPSAVAARFGPAGLSLQRLAAGTAQRDVSRRKVDEALAVEHSCDPPLERVDTAAFVARTIAQHFHTRLAAAGLACGRVQITADTAAGRRVQRTWRCSRPLDADGTADRLRWQLDGWLTAAAATGGVATDHGDEDGAVADWPDAITTVRLDAIEVVDPGLVQYGLWGADGDGAHRAGWAVSRVQGLLGPESVLAAGLAGGRGVSDRVVLTPWGEEATAYGRAAATTVNAPWPGALPSPTPATASDQRAVAVTDAGGHQILVTDRGLLSGPPAAVGRSPVRSWAGPWLYDERWWESAESTPWLQARMQVVPEQGPPVLLGFGEAGWRVEAVYD